MIVKPHHQILTGKTVDLIPLTITHSCDVVRLRSSPHIRAFFDENEPPTLAGQEKFFFAYADKPDDYYWVVCLKDGKVIGTNRLNDIHDGCGTKGSQTIDATHALSGPYGLEAEILLIDFGFSIMNLNMIDACIRADNEKVLTMNGRLGFRDTGTRNIRGLDYRVYSLARQDWKPEKLRELIDYFAHRAQGRTQS